MQPKEQVPEELDKPPLKPWAAGLISLFVYPGVAHFMLGNRKLGVALAVLFTLLTGGLVYEIIALAKPLLLLMTTGKPMDSAVSWPRILFWVLSSTLLWVGGALHSAWLANKQSAPEAAE